MDFPWLPVPADCCYRREDRVGGSSGGVRWYPGDRLEEAAPNGAISDHPVRRVTARITPYRNGPYLVRGDFTLTDQDGETKELTRRTIALCRCGKSRTRPFCDGTHKRIGFEAEGYVEGDFASVRISATERAERLRREPP